MNKIPPVLPRLLLPRLFTQIFTQSFLVFAAWVGSGGGLTTAAQETPLLHPLFSDHLVLQRGEEIPVWGWGVPGQQVLVTLQDKTAEATVEKNGRWQTKLPAFTAGGPFELTAKVKGGDQQGVQTIQDVLIGDVWICSGQSNMERPLSAAKNSDAEISAANYPNIRLFTVPRQISEVPVDSLEGRWEVCTSQFAKSFSAVGYFFGRDLHRELNVPIGLIDASWGGTVAEAWTSAEALESLEDFRPKLNALKRLRESRSENPLDQRTAMARWWRENDLGTREKWQRRVLTPSVEDPWKSIDLPKRWDQHDLAGFDGVVWFRKEFELPNASDSIQAELRLGPIDDRETTWINGKKIGQTDRFNIDRQYSIKPGVLRAGKNVIAIRVLDTGGAGGFFGQPNQMQIKFDDATSLPLKGSWSYKISVPLSKMSLRPDPPVENPNRVTVLYNGMIAPLEPYAIKGAIWYQGESNAGRAMQYRELLPTMIKDWRDRFGVGDFPFLIVQLANYMAPQQQPVEPGWAELREAQSMTAAKDERTGLAVAIDIGDANDIHPRNKQEVGRRLMLSALKIAYGRDVVASGPKFESVEYKSEKAIIKFSSIGSGLKAKEGKLKGFAIAGSDKTFVWADAVIDGDQVIVSSPAVSAPVAVRYGWANNPIATLVNEEGLPAIPFRSDVD
ncbi:Glycosyl hydrolases family 2, sugar binding domain [Novipirellula aureliae]|uniref:Glycosyl hydrolases family 2, sugar binding domain n=1 Tax=Novipirellula aureliae TaxID=2527966 RepID=A0A5C6EE61_9BACT|nr:sialate O-acetylesterase [Novipirellula aureliae]TWU45509.1 Glycosyl hydrolases family 2, sugar binding domain [Novipirellula aureliae]